MTESQRVFLEAHHAGRKPDANQTVSEWADKHRQLSQRASAEPGQWHTERTPYLREIMDCLSPSSPTERVVFMKGAQVGGTEAGNNWVGFVIHRSPAPMLIVAPTVELAKRNSKQRIDTLIEESDVLRELVREARSKDSGNTILSKEFRGGILVMTGANSAVGLRSMAARFLFLDETDGYPGDVEEEGDPISLAMARTRTFGRRKIFMVSTPGIEGLSRISKEFEESDQRRYFVPCPYCGHMQTLAWSNVKWPKAQPEKAFYECAGCAGEIGNHHKTAMLQRGEWIAQAPGPSKAAGFHLSALYSPVGWFSWADAARQFEEAQSDPTLLKAFVNTVLGQCWKEKGDAPDWEKLAGRAEDYSLGTVPSGALFLTAGVDVQKDRLEIDVWGWGRGKGSWLVDHTVLEGDPARGEVWQRLTHALNDTYVHESGAFVNIACLAIDSGYATTEVYGWARQQGPARVIVTKGFAEGVALLGQPSSAEVNRFGQRSKAGVRVWPINTTMAKSEFYGLLRQDRPEDGQPFPPGWVHFPAMPDEWFKQLVAESYVTRVVKGFRKGEWIKMRERNEALDLRVLARAAAEHLHISQMNEKHWAQLEQKTVRKVERQTEARRDAEEARIINHEPERPPAPPVATTERPKRRPRVIQSSWMNR